MKNGRKRRQTDLGNLIAALYDEVKRVTRNKRLQTVLVYMALLDLHAVATR